MPFFRARAAVPLGAALALFVSPSSAVVWVKSSGGASCETVCAARSGCTEDAWPKSEEDFKVITESLGFECAGTQEGGAKYDPSTDGRYCGWQGPNEANADESRCSETGDEGTYRFCPCNSDKEL
mmetsp:Transcript_82855/g.231050  ORF Transcript_82855/g.231050 Transcript_82855/m.231050 type:complete len:125 (+) Transcript_82855:76-450(+)